MATIWRSRSDSSHVAPLAGSVDRNPYLTYDLVTSAVAPLAGSVDRNAGIKGDFRKQVKVAPLAGSVDRNAERGFVNFGKSRRSPRGERG